MRLLTLLLAALVAGLAFLWGGEAWTDEPVVPSEPSVRAPRAARQGPEAPGTTVDVSAEVGEPGQVEREAVAPATATLGLRFVDAATGEPHEGSVQLWQLGLPADDEWTAGDRKVFDDTATGGELTLTDLSPGTYRAHAWDARLGSEAPPAFELVAHLDGRPLVVTWPVVPAVDEAMWLVAVDEHGSPVEQLSRKNRNGWRLRSHGGAGPDWADERRRKDELGYAFGIGGGVGGGGGHRRGSHVRWIELEPGPDGLALGRITQDSRRIGRTQTEYLRRGDDDEVTVVIEPRGANRFYVVLPDRAAVLERLVLPDEDLRERAERALGLRVEALALGPDRSEAQAWLEARVQVKLHLADHEPIDVSWHPSIEEPPSLVLRPALPSGS